MTALAVRDLHVYLGESHVLQGVSFTVPNGGVTGVMGRNGVGKTTTLRALLGLAPRSRGTVTLDGTDVTAMPTHKIVRRGVGYVPEDREVFAGLTVSENLRLASRVPIPDYDLVYDLFPVLRERGGQRAGTLSGGEQRWSRSPARCSTATPACSSTSRRSRSAHRQRSRSRPRAHRRADDRRARRAEPRRPATAREARCRPRRRARRARGAGRRSRDDPERVRRFLECTGAAISTFVLLTIAGLGLGAVYFLVASGLSLIYGLMGVLNFAHGVLIAIGAYSAWWVGDQLSGPAEVSLLAGTAFALLVGAVIAAAIELVFIRPLYRRPIEQILVTVGLALALGALIVGIFGPETKVSVVPSWMIDTTMVLGEPVPNDRFVEIAVAAVVLVGLIAFLRYTRYGLVIRAGVENSVDGHRARRRRAACVHARLRLGRRAGRTRGSSLERVLRVGRAGPRDVAAHLRVHRRRDRRLRLDRGAAVAEVAVALLQNYANFYGTTGAGDMAVVALLAITLLVRPRGLAPQVAH